MVPDYKDEGIDNTALESSARPDGHMDRIIKNL